MLRDKLVQQLQGRLQEYLSLNVYGKDKVVIAMENHGELTECSTFSTKQFRNGTDGFH